MQLVQSPIARSGEAYIKDAEKSGHSRTAVLNTVDGCVLEPKSTSRPRSTVLRGESSDCIHISHGRFYTDSLLQYGAIKFRFTVLPTVQPI